MLICYCFLVSKTCTGCSCDICSWKIQEDIAKVPFTGHQFYIRSPCNCHCTFILRVPLGDQQFLIAFSTIFPYLQFYRHGGYHEGDWIFFDYAIEWKLCTWIEHAAVFKDEVNVVTGDARIGILNLLDKQPCVRMLEVHGGDQAPVPGFIEFSCFRWTSFRGSVAKLNVKGYVLYLLRMEWVKVNSLGNPWV